MKPQTREGAELYATLTGQNVQTPERPRPSGIGVPEVAFGLGFLAAVAGLALVSVAVALVFAGVALAFAAWYLS